VFHQLGVSEIKKIVNIQLGDLMKRLSERRIELTLTEAASAELATEGFDPVYGARPLKRAIQRDIVNPLAQAILKGEVRDGQTVSVDFHNGEYVFTHEAVPA
jgi:ATP-dependent Clp protease ATP-binding subunit ClpB